MAPPTTGPIVTVVDSQGRTPSGQRGVLPWGYEREGALDGYCPACTWPRRDRLPVRSTPADTFPGCGHEAERCAGCGHDCEAIAAAQLEAFAAQQREYARHSVNPVTEDGLALPTGVRGLIRVF